MSYEMTQNFNNKTSCKMSIDLKGLIYINVSLFSLYLKTEIVKKNDLELQGQLSSQKVRCVYHLIFKFTYYIN